MVARELYAQLRPRPAGPADRGDLRPLHPVRAAAAGGSSASGKRGEAKDFIRDGLHARGGSLPINPHGGQLGEAYIHGMNGVAEAVRQVRGSAANQVDNVENVLVTAGTGVPTSGLILGAA